MIQKILIANRGEIAIRVMRTCREMGIKTVAIFSEADRLSPHVLYADEAWPLRGNLSSESYLDIEQITSIIKISKADAIHPGYGFLSENTDFAKAITDLGCIFIGPSSEAIRVMGDKTAAREAVIDQDVPLIPGSKRAIENDAEALKDAERIGYPVLVKAAGGGGGKGMHKVRESKNLLSTVQKA
ncbi:MAG: acetyl-CoA carboxylase biotin carboxylase subunit, partial [Candidatus Marinimicrobia bacterium]|nr:acetyl-CoA carboxylase biotin carboxylase subunit [Candidatus Neomarinimicrobiota bacterium]